MPGHYRADLETTAGRAGDYLADTIGVCGGSKAQGPHVRRAGLKVTSIGPRNLGGHSERENTVRSEYSEGVLSFNKNNKLTEGEGDCLPFFFALVAWNLNHTLSLLWAQRIQSSTTSCTS